jgi:hypothetical protein
VEAVRVELWRAEYEPRTLRATARRLREQAYRADR